MSTPIESDHVQINASQETIFLFLSDFNNIQTLLPQDKISEWMGNVDFCSFKIQNAATIALVKSSVEPNEKINIKSGDKTPFPFKLEVFINQAENNTCEGYFKFEGEINAFLKMMVMKPLTNLFNYMANRLKEVHS
jgi:hypothetical protein